MVKAGDEMNLEDILYELLTEYEEGINDKKFSSVLSEYCERIRKAVGDELRNVQTTNVPSRREEG